MHIVVVGHESEDKAPVGSMWFGVASMDHPDPPPLGAALAGAVATPTGPTTNTIAPTAEATSRPLRRDHPAL